MLVLHEIPNPAYGYDFPEITHNTTGISGNLDIFKSLILNPTSRILYIRSITPLLTELYIYLSLLHSVGLYATNTLEHLSQ